LQFQFASGHSVECKAPGDDAKKKIAEEILERIKFPQEGREGFVAHVAADPEGLITCAQRTVSLRRLRQRSGNQVAMADVQAMLYGERSEPADSTPDELKAAMASAPPPPAGAHTLILFYPTGQDAHADWIWHQLHEASKKLGDEFPFSQPIRKTYELDPPSAAPFTVAAECVSARPHAALVLGPVPGCSLAEHEGDFKYALGHLIRDVSTRLGWVNYREMKNSQAFANAYLDVCETAGVWP
jgi:hypothetical protein